MESTLDVIEKCRKEAITRAKADAVDVSATMKVGEEFRQGDIYITRLLKAVPSGAERVDAVRQLAPGNSQGSRHCLSTLKGVTMYRLPNPSPLKGPVFTTENPITVEHPEHGHVTLPAGTFGIEYQRQYAEELRRVAD